jgi:hypothetical protein
MTGERCHGTRNTVRVPKLARSALRAQLALQRQGRSDSNYGAQHRSDNESEDRRARLNSVA